MIRPVYFGARQVNLKPTKKINTPADLAGIKLRMPPASSGSSSANRSAPIRRRWPIAELYTALQSGAVDGQDNPLGLRPDTMKFYEVTRNSS